ncbi:MAG: undecaprenyl/decaprenyl-phosphate alpha-N-acetylglucosaminyl 1-phosphate transferase [Phototrophicales bacterium]|nr:MAG: undecaprenyl/decaprenyl-phosphate alpha-N-acetylglucosaminyl 1-phosphate transferase [Phototrophicales bacterium]
MSHILREYGVEFALIFGVSFGLSLLLTPLTMRLSYRYGIVKAPGGRRRHTTTMPLLGGWAIVISFLVTVLIAQFLPVERTDEKEIIRLTGLIIGSLIMAMVGFFDDKYELSPLPVYITQLLVGGIAVFFLIIIESFNNPLNGQTVTGWPYVVTVTLTLLWLGFMMNTVNWLDGLDGLAGGVTVIASFMIFYHATFELNQVSVGILALALVGATLGFLIFNFHPAKVFMGGSAWFLGYALGVLGIIGGAKVATILLVMGLPLFDVTWQIMRRLLSGKNPMKGDRGHLHFLLADMGFDQRTIVIGYYIFCALFGSIALITTSRLFKLISLLVMLTILVLVFAITSWQATRHQTEEKTSGSTHSQS